jgi:MYXO-CTERM domain-containing protein
VVSSCKGVADGALCTDRNSCTVGDVCFNDVCMGSVVGDGTPCTDENQCTANDLCKTGVCIGTPLADGTPCTDEEVCTDPDTCQTGICVPGPTLACDDGDPCTQDVCVLGDGCHYDMMAVCPDGGVDAGLPDAGPPDAVPADADVDLPPDAAAGEDALDDGSMDLPKVYRAQGGACVCSTSSAPPSATVLGLAVAALALSWRRKHRR